MKITSQYVGIETRDVKTVLGESVRHREEIYKVYNGNYDSGFEIRRQIEPTDNTNTPVSIRFLGDCRDGSVPKFPQFNWVDQAEEHIAAEIAGN